MNKKNLSQNFLIDKNIKKNIIKKIKIKKNDIIIELGAGKGAISKEIATLSKKSFLIEIDKCLVKNLNNDLDYIKNVKILNENILKINLKDITKKYKKIRIIGNIPYKITTKILKLIENFSKNINDVHLVIQKEMADKITNESINSPTNLILNYKFKIKKIFDIKPKAFNPIPKINSSFIKLNKKKKIEYIINYSFFKKIIKLAFENKRKKIKKSIKDISYIKKYINIDKRPEEINLNEFIRISNLLFITRLGIA